MNKSLLVSDNAQRRSGWADVVVSTVAIAMFVGLSGWLLPIAWSNISGARLPISRELSAALLLNVAFILLVWRRSRQLFVQKRATGDAQQRAEQNALRDYATGLSNRPAILTAIEDCLARGEEISLIAFDLDHFKKVNDLYGHEAGDQLLIGIAKRLVNIVPKSAICARLGGDEFAILLSGKEAARHKLLATAEKIQASFEEEFVLSNGSAKVGASLGVYGPVDPESSSADIFRRGDIAMYHAKKKSGKQIAVFEPMMETEVHQRYQMEADIRAGIPRGEFVPYYQPQYCIGGDNLLGFEVLARWNHPERRLVEPADFIPIAEDTGLIAPLSMSVMRQALMDAASWDHSLILAVNISPLQLNDPALDQQIMKLLAETGFPPQRLELEITESALMEDTALVLNTITSLKSLGIKISLDDFGTGYSSMTQLKNFPFDRIKIDRSFVHSMLDNEESAAIINSIASLAASLDVPITAEGIESDEIRTCLAKIGCTDGQGWFYGRPASREELLKLLPGISLKESQHDLLDAIEGGLDRTVQTSEIEKNHDLKRSNG